MSRFAWIAGLALLLARPALAQTPLPLELEWQAPAECPSAAAVRAELARVASVRAGFTLRPLRATIVVRHRASTYLALLRTEHEGRSGERQLTAADCRTLTRSVTLVLALAFGTGVEVRELGEPRQPSGSSAGPASPAPTAVPNGTAAGETRSNDSEQLANAQPPASAQPPAATRLPAAVDNPQPRLETSDADNERSRELQANLWLGAGVHFALLPDAAFMAGIGAELELDRYSLGVRAWVSPGASELVRADTSEIESHYSAFGAAVDGCALVPLASLGLAACAALQAAAVRGTSDDTPRTRGDAATAAWYSVAAGLAVDFPRRARLRARLEANLAVSLNRPRFEIEAVGPAFHVPGWVPLVAAGVVFAP